MSYSDEKPELPKKKRSAKKAEDRAEEASTLCTKPGCTERWIIHSPDRGIYKRCRAHAEPEEQTYSLIMARIRSGKNVGG